MSAGAPPPAQAALSRAPLLPRLRRLLSRVAFASVASLGACASPPAADAGPPPIWDVAAGRFITEDELVARLSNVRFRLLGEIHDNAEHHRLRAGLIRRIAANGRRPVVVFEQFDLEHDAALVAAQRADPRADAEAIAAAGSLNRRAWDWPLHKPLLDAARDAGLAIRAGNPTRAELMRAARAAPDDPLDTRWGARFSGAVWTAAQDAVLRSELADGHCGKLPERALAPMARAQRMRDAALAQALIDAANADGAILIAGNTHVRRDLGAPVYMHPSRAAPGDATTLSVGFIESQPEDRRAPDFPRTLLGNGGTFDIVWFTGTTSRGDPCAQVVVPALPK